MDTSWNLEMGSASDSEGISVGSLVQYLDNKLGIVRWIGYLPDFSEKSAGLEVVNTLCTNSTVVIFPKELLKFLNN